MHNENYVLTLQLVSVQLNKVWFLSNVYGPCDGPQRLEFVNWFESLKVDIEALWLFMGDLISCSLLRTETFQVVT